MGPVPNAGATSAGESAAIETMMSPLGDENDGNRIAAPRCSMLRLHRAEDRHWGRTPHASTIEPEYAPIGIELTGVDGPLARQVADLRAAFA